MMKNQPDRDKNGFILSHYRFARTTPFNGQI
jgi:hypothetical protein